jgi:thiamine-monophosphate kinase
MKLSEIGEFGFISRFSPLFASLVPESFTGIGDDCAIIPQNGKEDLVITTDLLIENIHFLRDSVTPDQLGYKSLAVNLSDIAAMGAAPAGSFLSLAIPADTEVEYLDAFMKSYHAISEQYEVPLLGGDTTRSPGNIAISVCVIGKCPKNTAKLRSTANDEDIVCVTGHLGDSAGGFKVILEKTAMTSETGYLVNRHYMPVPRLPEGRLLASLPGVTAMMDISDGLASDLMQILKASGKSGTVDLDKLPLSEMLEKVSFEQGWDPIELATAGGEDYELLCTVSPSHFKDVSEHFFSTFGKKLYPIGRINKGQPSVQWIREGREIIFVKKGFDHFK